jgi:xanthine dehydrogenase iron-sulfur cluster and FAD-binding subunit A
LSTETQFIVCSKKRGFRTINASDFFLGYRKTALEDDEVLVSIKYPIPTNSEYREAFFQTKRRTDDIAIVTCSFSIEFEGKNSFF